ncbi:Phospholipase A-2-activating protein [Mycena indigotica]|uniref:Phospholipase A-2-activating protein n=1 Tax=Mycena indigotica TaxID=2126181 RepID=A0A8H6SAW9_9AGAR|nr:Phospholipase A-2-activating protein [Mycena indigotica]KAF7295597.1 Phospholipase A-2-activating protein [Mycena indigotica]
MPYKLSATLAGHTSDVRALSTPSDDLILSSSRDSTAIVWRATTPPAFAQDSVFHPSTRYVNAVAYLPPSAEAPKGYAVTGDQDGIINVYSLEPAKDDPDYTLLGHSGNVCGLRTTPGGQIVSCSWDATARVWKNFAQVYELKGHENSVWDVLAVNEEQFITGSADKTIKVWKQNKAIHSFNPHNGVVRSLALIPDIGFASCADNEIRVWTVNGDLIYSLTGHTSFIYQLAVLPSGDLVSSSEDRTVRVWKDGECAQVLVHPAISVWTVSTMPNGDIVSGASDKNVRVFSAAEQRWASEGDLKSYDDIIAQQSLAAHDVEQVKVEASDALNTPGKKVGQTLLVSKGDVTEVYQWDGNAWQRIGERADGPSGSEKPKAYFEGREYDYVWSVAIEDGEPALKLPYNITEAPADAATRFLERNGLPLSHVSTVVDFIYQNTPGQMLGPQGGENYVDPFTGASRYRSSAQSSAASGPASSYMDPYTGASRYTSSAPVSNNAPASSYMDPYTGASRYSGGGAQAAASPPPSKPVSSVLPVVQPVLLKEGNLPAMKAKLHQYNDGLQSEISTMTLAFYPEEIRAIDESFNYVQQCSTGSRPTNPLSAAHVDALIHILERWPSSLRLPVLDLARLVVAYCPEAVRPAGIKERLFSALFSAADWTSSSPPPLPSPSKPAEMNVMLVFRALANVMQEAAGATDGTWLAERLQVASAAGYDKLSPTQRKPRATMLLNVSCISLFTPMDSTTRSAHLTMIAEVLTTEKSDSESVYRALVGLGNIVYASKQHQVPLDAAQTALVGRAIKDLPGRFNEERIRGVVVEIGALLVSGVL